MLGRTIDPGDASLRGAVERTTGRVEDERGWTPLIRAAARGDAEAVEAALRDATRAGTLAEDLFVRDSRGRSAADWARKVRSEECASLLERAEAAFVRDATRRHTEAVRLSRWEEVLRRNARLHEQAEAALALNDAEAISRVLKLGREVEGVTRERFTEAQNELRRLPPFAADLLGIPFYADAEAANGWSALAKASAEDSVVRVREALDAGADVNLCLRTDQTALGFAAACGYEEVVGLLLSRGADVFRVTPREKHTALMSAAAKGYLAVTHRLVVAARDRCLDSFAPMRGKESFFTAPNHWSAFFRDYVAQRDAFGLTAEEQAAAAGHEVVARFLREVAEYADERLIRWEIQREGKRWSRCTLGCGARMRTEDLARHVEFVCDRRPEIVMAKAAAAVKERKEVLATLAFFRAKLERKRTDDELLEALSAPSKRPPSEAERKSQKPLRSDVKWARAFGRRLCLRPRGLWEGEAADPILPIPAKEVVRVEVGDDGRLLSLVEPPRLPEPLPDSNPEGVATVAARNTSITRPMFSSASLTTVPATTLRAHAPPSPTRHVPPVRLRELAGGVVHSTTNVLDETSPGEIGEAETDDAVSDPAPAVASHGVGSGLRADSERAHRPRTPPSQLSMMPCPLGCGSQMVPSDVPRHLTERCMRRMIHCPLGCGDRIEVGDRHTHEQRDCVRRLVRCTCGQYFPFEDLRSHATFDCPCEPLLCPLKCSTMVPRAQLGTHGKLECAKRVVPCPRGCPVEGVLWDRLEAHLEDDCVLQLHACAHGCGAFIARIDLPGHERVCTQRLVDCPRHCGSRFMLGELLEHEATCPARGHLCPLGCGARVVPGERGALLLRHTIEDCTRRLTPCPQLCGITLPWDELASHIGDLCPNRRVVCPNGCGETLRFAQIPLHQVWCWCQPASCGADSALCVRQLRAWFDGDVAEGRGDLRACLAHGSTPLLWAARQGRASVVSLIAGAVAEWDRGHRVSTLDKEMRQGDTPLVAACETGHERVVDLLLDLGATPDLETSRGWTPLLVAAARGHTRIVRTLLRRGATLAYLNKFGKSAAWWAERGGHADLARELYDRGASLLCQRELFIAIGTNDTRAVGELLHDPRTLRQIAAETRALLRREGHEPGGREAREVLPSSEPPRRRSSAAMKVSFAGGRAVPAAASSSVEAPYQPGFAAHMREELASARVDVELARQDGARVRSFLVECSPRYAERCETHGAEPPQARESSVQAELRRSWLEAVGRHSRLQSRLEAAERLLRGSYTLQLASAGGHTPLAYAAAVGVPDVIRVLLRNGASPEFSDEFFESSAGLIQRVWRRYRELCEGEVAQFRTPQTRVEHRLRSVMAALERAVWVRQYREVRRKERLPLWEATFNGHPECIRLLLEAGASPWRQAWVLPEGPIPFAPQRPLPVRVLEDPGTGRSTIVGAMVEVLRLEHGRELVLPEDDPFRALDEPSAHQTGTSNTKTKAETDRWFRDPLTGVLTLFEDEPEERVAGPGVTELALEDWTSDEVRKRAIRALPMPLVLIEAASLGYLQLGHRTFEYGIGWTRRDKHSQAMRLVEDTLANAAKARFEQREHARRAREAVEHAASVRRWAVELDAAYYVDDFDRVLRLLEHGLSIEFENVEGHNPLTKAALRGSYARDPTLKKRALAVILMLERHTRGPAKFVNHEASVGLTPLAAAAVGGQNEVVSALLQRGANKDQALQGGAPPSTYARNSGMNTEVGIPWAELRGKTPLMLAALRGHYRTVQLLLDEGANPDLVDAHGLTALDLAFESRALPAAGILRNAARGTRTGEARSLAVLDVGPAVEICPHGCGKRYVRGTGPAHASECPRAPVACPNECGAGDLWRADLETHILDECPLRRVRCPRGCVEVILGREWDDHWQHTCPKRPPGDGDSARGTRTIEWIE